MASNGVVGTVVGHPLADWSALEGFQPPAVLHQSAHRILSDWDAERRRVEQARRDGRLAGGGVYHGFFFMRLTYLRGFENLMCDLVEQPPQLGLLAGILKDHTAAMLRHWLELDVDVVTFGEDLGTQRGPMISPEMFARFVTPVYRELMAPVRRAGKLVYLHSDGCVIDLMDEFAAAGVDIINPQDLVNGIDRLARRAKGRFCIDLDVDRQSVVPFGRPPEIRQHIEQAVRTLGSPAGGLMLKVAIYPPAPPENVEAVCSAFEQLRTYWSD
jgi:uroporphyrinogen-III decarboxylase